MTPLAATIARDVPDAPQELVERVTEAVRKELWSLIHDHAERYYKPGTKPTWHAFCMLANEVNALGISPIRRP